MSCPSTVNLSQKLSTHVICRLGGNPNAHSRDENSHSPLTLSASAGHLEIMDLLLSHNADLETTTKYKVRFYPVITPVSPAAFSHTSILIYQETALHTACRYNHAVAVRLLTSRNASLVVRNYKNQTPLDVAVESMSREAAAEIITGDRWKEAMACLDSNHHNPLPRMIAYLPSVAELVLDKCIVTDGDPDSDDYSVTYNFEYVDIHPDSEAMNGTKVWYAKVSA